VERRDSTSSQGFPDCQILLEHVIAEGDIVAANTRFTGTHLGLFHWANYGPWEPTGKFVDAREMDFFRLADGKVVEMWVMWDRTTFVRQLGVVDLPPARATT
jgi:predicted ester cyclase